MKMDRDRLVGIIAANNDKCDETPCRDCKYNGENNCLAKMAADSIIKHFEKTKGINILCVEDGSVDLDELKESGLKDGQILVYRQGATPPFVLKLGEG